MTQVIGEMPFATKTPDGGYVYNDNSVFRLGEHTRFFGQSREDPYRSQFETKHRNFQLSELYKNRSDFLGEMVIGLFIFDDDPSWLFSSENGLPIKRTTEQRWNWHVVKFDVPMLQIVPYEGVSRVISSSYEENSTTSERRGLACVTEHEFYKRPEGLRHMMRSLQQMANATRITMEYAVLVKITTTRSRDVKWILEHTKISRYDYRELCRHQARGFAVGQKSYDATIQRLQDFYNMLVMRQKKPRTLIIPHGCGQFLKLSGEDTRYDVSGSRGPSQREKNPRLVTRVPGLPDLDMCFTRMFRDFDDMAGFDPLIRNRMVGQFHVHKGLRIDMVDAKTYRTWMRDLWVMDYGKNSYACISLKQCVENMLPWDETDVYGHTWLKGMRPPYPLREGYTAPAPGEPGEWRNIDISKPHGVRAPARRLPVPELAITAGERERRKREGIPINDYDDYQEDTRFWPDLPEAYVENAAAGNVPITIPLKEDRGAGAPPMAIKRYDDYDLFGCYVGGGMSPLYDYVRELGHMNRKKLPMDLFIAMARCMEARNMVMEIPVTGDTTGVSGDFTEEYYFDNRRDDGDAYTRRSRQYPTLFRRVPVAGVPEDQRDLHEEMELIGKTGKLKSVTILHQACLLNPALAEITPYEKYLSYIASQNWIASTSEYLYLQELYRKLSTAMLPLQNSPTAGEFLTGSLNCAFFMDFRRDTAAPIDIEAIAGEAKDQNNLQVAAIRRRGGSLSAKIDAAKPQASLSATDRHALNRTFFKNAKNPSYDRITDAIGKENVAGGVGKFATTVRDLIERHGHDTTAVKTHVIDRLDAIAAPLATSQVDEVKEKFHGSMDTFFKDSEAIAAASHTASASTDASTVSSLSHGDRETQEARVKEMFEELGKEFSQDKETLEANVWSRGARFFGEATNNVPLRSRGVNLRDGYDKSSPLNFNSSEWEWRMAQIQGPDSRLSANLRKNCIWLMRMKITKENLFWLLDNDIVFPFSFLTMRPFGRIQTSTAIVAQMGPATGFTAIGESDMMFADDVSNKTHELHYTIECAAVVTDDLAFGFVDDICTRHYHGGLNCRWMTMDDVDRYKNGGLAPLEQEDGNTASMYPVITTYDLSDLDNVIDVRGHFGIGDNRDDVEPHFVSTRCCRDIWNYNNARKANDPMSAAEVRVNTTVMQAQQWSYNPYAGDISAVTRGIDHLGDCVYGGMVDVLNCNASNEVRFTYAKMRPGVPIVL